MLHFLGLEMLVLQSRHVAIQKEVIYARRQLRNFVRLFLKLLTCRFNFKFNLMFAMAMTTKRRSIG